MKAEVPYDYFILISTRLSHCCRTFAALGYPASATPRNNFATQILESRPLLPSKDFSIDRFSLLLLYHRNPNSLPLYHSSIRLGGPAIQSLRCFSSRQRRQPFIHVALQFRFLSMGRLNGILLRLSPSTQIICTRIN